ncbi:YbaB/EbfC family nucleoid-associated protein [Streptosporangium sp. NPDC004379]|uniref:YbaB/EbfC family nucleoid-associated protein n=1 Tax=Streptosporangium sp. NPDC004379 TaxID=3366189 RepID=UPI0036B04229
MNDGFPQTIKAMAHEYNRQAERLRQAYSELAELTATARSDDQMVTVTVGPRGQIQNIELDPRVYRKLSPSELSQSIMEQIGAAVAQTAERTKELMEPFLPAGLPYEQVFGEEASLESFLPQPVDLRRFEEGANG